MGRFDKTEQTIDANIKTNGKQAITGSVLNSVMKDMLDATDKEFTELSVDCASVAATDLNLLVVEGEVYDPHGAIVSNSTYSLFSFHVKIITHII